MGNRERKAEEAFVRDVKNRLKKKKNQIHLPKVDIAYTYQSPFTYFFNIALRIYIGKPVAEIKDS